MHPEGLEVITIPSGRSVTVLIKAAGRDVGRVIGERGAHFNALKTLATAIGLKQGVSVELEPVPDPTEPGKAERYEKFKAREDWPKAEIVELLKATAQAVLRFEDLIEVVCEDLSDSTTMATVICSGANPAGLVDPIQTALKALFNAVGKANGRTIFVVVRPSQKSEPPQPKTAAGRFSK